MASRLPRAVERQAEAAEKLHAQVYGTPETAPDQNPVTAEQAEPQPDSSASSAPPNAEPVIADEGVRDKPVEEGGDLDHWRQRSKVAEGRLTKEMPRLAQTIRELKDQLSEAQSKLNRLESASPVASNSDGIKPEEVEQYGQEFIDMVKRAAKSANPGIDGDLKKQLDKVLETNREVTRQQFFLELKREAPSWETLNVDQDFLNYLTELDPFTGRARQELFDEAYEKLDAWRISAFFNSFSNTRQKPETYSVPSRANQVVPSSSRATAPPESKKSWTTTSVARFYDEMRRGIHAPEAASRIEADIFAAQSDGRLR